jgi:hypothetical protein
MKVDITLNNMQLVINEEYIVSNGFMEFRGTFLGIKTDQRGTNLSIYMLVENIGEIGISVKDIETICHIP